jgi:chromosome segregation ATPase
MRSGFDANVPARKPRTQAGRVLLQLASDPQPDAEVAVEPVPTEAPPAAAPAAPPVAAPARPLPATSDVATPRVAPAETTERSRLAASQERLAALRERLAAAERAPQPGRAARRTPGEVREAIEQLRARTEAALKEKAELALALEETRAALERAAAELERERRARAAAEAVGAERQQIADDAVAEAVALAAERDQMLAELTAQRRLDDEQSALLAQAEAALGARETERAAAASQIAELRDLADERGLEAAELRARADADAVERRRLEERCRTLEAEVARLGDVDDALGAIEAAIARGA